MNRSATLDIDALKAEFVGREFDSIRFVLEAERLATAARMCGETRPEYLDTGRPDFQATPAYLASLGAGRHLPETFPDSGIPMDGGKTVIVLAPVKPGETLTGRTRLHDIYAKNGRSGRMVFVVSRMQIHDAGGQHLATSDSHMVIRERPGS